MKSIHVDTTQIHSNTLKLNYSVKTPIEGLGHPEIRLTAYNKAGEDGGVVSNQFYGMRTINLEGYIRADSVALYESARRALEALFFVEKDSNNVPIAKTLKFVTLDDYAFQVEVYVKNFVSDITNVGNGRFLAQLIAAKHGIESQTLNTEILDRPSGGGATYPVIYPVIYDAALGGNTAINNAGSSNAYPIITLSGPLTNPYIQNQTIDATLTYSGTIAEGSQVVIDMREKTVILDGTSNKIANIVTGSDFWWLKPGDNVINFSTDSTSDDGQCQIKYRETYIGI